MKTNEIRSKYLDFFKSKGHTICESDVLVPKWDNTVLFTPAGMNPFKDHFLGNVDLEFTRATSCQKCLRTGDIENVGRTAYHHTFFEMLGNFSFGDYFKRDAIHWAWEFLTDKKWLGIDAERLTVSVYSDDDEAEQIWMNDIGLPKARIERLGEHDNFWPAGAPSDGPDGVCGPCSEIFFHPDNGPECEIWNLVFTQFNRAGDPPDNLSPLPNKNIDTGMGLERIAAVLQGKVTNYHIDSLLPLVEAAGEICGIKYQHDSENGRRLRRIADHVRACSMAIHENVYPDKNKENYVIRRLLRRSVLQGHEMGLRDPFLYKLVPAVVDAMSEPYPHIKETVDNVANVIKTEEENFFRTLDGGLNRIEKIFSEMQSNGVKTVDGKQAFDLYQEQGIPAELFQSIADDRGFGFDWESYTQAKDKHAKDSGAGEVGVMGNEGPLGELKQNLKSTQFTGYAGTKDNGVVGGLIIETTQTVTQQQADGQQVEQEVTVQNGVESLSTDPTHYALVVLDRTPLYAESGGQVSDHGTIVGPNGRFNVTDVKKSGDLFLHYGKMAEGQLAKGDAVSIEVDEARRSGIERAHTATHILHYALQKHVGQEAQQRGSKVEEDQLRFDFANRDGAVPANLLQLVETESIARVDESADVSADVIPMQQAREQGAMMLFGEKYPDPVRMVSIGQYSKELCGGTHVKNTSDVGEFELVNEESVSTGVRRIVAFTGQKAKQHAAHNRQLLDELSKKLNTSPSQVLVATENLLAFTKALKKQISGGKPAELASINQQDEPQLDYPTIRDSVKNVAKILNVQTDNVVDRIAALQNDVETLQQQLEQQASLPKITADSLWDQVSPNGDVNVVVSETAGANADLMRKLIDQLRKKHSNVAIFLAAQQGPDKVTLLAGLSKDLVQRGLSAGDWVKKIAPIVGGGGGGRPDMAQAGGKDPSKISDALEAARQFIAEATTT